MDSLYALLEVPPDATDQDVKTAYRKKALKVHPDKNPDNPEAAKLFHQLSEAFKVLSDPTAKGAYDKGLKAKQERELRDRKLDAKQKKLKDELEARERQAAAEELLKSEHKRSEQQRSRQWAEELERFNQEMASKRQSAQKTAHSLSCRLKVKWKCPNVYTKEKLHQILQKYGDITALVVSSKRNNAIVEFANRKNAERALSVERGLGTSPLKLSMIEGQNQQMSAPIQEQRSTYQGPVAASFEEYEARVLQNILAPLRRERENSS